MQNFNLNTNPLDNLSGPLQQLMELNKKTFKKFTKFEPENLSQIHNPQDIIEHNMQMFIDNSHTTLDYMHELFNIFESSWVNLSHYTDESTKEMLKRTQSVASSTMNKMSHMSSPMTKNSTSKKRTRSSSKRKHVSSRDEASNHQMKASSSSDKK